MASRLAGRTTDLAIASVGKGGKSSGVKVWTIDPTDGTLAEIGDGPTFQAFDGGDPYGLCTYRSPRDGLPTSSSPTADGAVEQYRLDHRPEATPTHPGDACPGLPRRLAGRGDRRRPRTGQALCRRGRRRYLGVRRRAGRRVGTPSSWPASASTD